jgi:predicted acyl esterase
MGPAISRRHLAKCIASLLVLAATAAPARGSHGEDVTFTGHIAAGNPMVVAFPGASELVAACSPGGAGDGLDGAAVALPEGGDGHPARVDFFSPAPADVSVYFFDSNCAFMGDDGGLRSAGIDEPEVGFIPEFARYAEVDLAFGADADYSFTVFLSQPSVLPDLGTPIPLDRIEPFAVKVQDQPSLVPGRPASPVELRGHVYVPEGAGPFGTVLEFSPYWNWAYGRSDDRDVVRDGRRTMEGDLRRFLEAGFAVALVNIRGSGLSDGCLEWGGPLDRGDAYAVVEALADEPWSNGNVGMYGHSYPAWMAYVAMASHAPSLRAVIPMSGLVDLWSYFSVRGATFSPQFPNVFWKPLFGIAAIAEGNDPLSTTRPGCRSMVDEIDQYAPIWNGDRNAYHSQRDLRDFIAGSPVPVFATTGLRFWATPTSGEGPGVFQTEDLWELLNGNVRIMVGQWGHDLPLRPDFAELSVAWFDQYLRGGPMTVPPGVAEYQDDSGAWHSTTHWPPAPNQALFLSDGALVPDAGDVTASSASFQGVGSPCLRLCAWDTNVDACVGNHVAYSTAPLAADERLAGEFNVELRIASDLPDGNFVAYLIESDTGACADPTARVVARAATDLRHIRTEEGELFPTGAPADVSLWSMPFATQLHAGKRLTLAIGGDGDEFRLLPDAFHPRVTLTTSPGIVGALHLPVVED